MYIDVFKKNEIYIYHIINRPLYERKYKIYAFCFVFFSYPLFTYISSVFLSSSHLKKYHLKFFTEFLK